MAVKRILRMMSFDEVDEKVRMGLCLVCGELYTVEHQLKHKYRLMMIDKEPENDGEALPPLSSSSLTSFTPFAETRDETFSATSSLTPKISNDDDDDDDAKKLHAGEDNVSGSVSNPHQTIKEEPIADLILEPVDEQRANDVVASSSRSCSNFVIGDLRYEFMIFASTTMVPTLSRKVFPPPEPPDRRLHTASTMEQLTQPNNMLLSPPPEPPEPPDSIAASTPSLNHALSRHFSVIQFPGTISFRLVPTTFQVYGQLISWIVAALTHVITGGRELKMILEGLSLNAHSLGKQHIPTEPKVFDKMPMKLLSITSLCIVNGLVNVAIDLFKHMNTMHIMPRKHALVSFCAVEIYIDATTHVASNQVSIHHLGISYTKVINEHPMIDAYRNSFEFSLVCYNCLGTGYKNTKESNDLVIITLVLESNVVLDFAEAFVSVEISNHDTYRCQPWSFGRVIPIILTIHTINKHSDTATTCGALIVDQPRNFQEFDVDIGVGLFEVNKAGDEYLVSFVDCKDVSKVCEEINWSYLFVLQSYFQFYNFKGSIIGNIFVVALVLMVPRDNKDEAVLLLLILSGRSFLGAGCFSHMRLPDHLYYLWPNDQHVYLVFKLLEKDPGDVHVQYFGFLRLFECHENFCLLRGMNNRGVSYTFDAEKVLRFLHKLNHIVLYILMCCDELGIEYVSVNVFKRGKIDAYFNQVATWSDEGFKFLANANRNATHVVDLEYGLAIESIHMNYMVEFIVTNPTLSFNGASDILSDDEYVQLCCVQTKAVQQWVLDLATKVFLVPKWKLCKENNYARSHKLSKNSPLVAQHHVLLAVWHRKMIHRGKVRVVKVLMKWKAALTTCCNLLLAYSKIFSQHHVVVVVLHRKMIYNGSVPTPRMKVPYIVICHMKMINWGSVFALRLLIKWKALPLKHGPCGYSSLRTRMFEGEGIVTGIYNGLLLIVILIVIYFW